MQQTGVRLLLHSSAVGSLLALRLPGEEFIQGRLCESRAPTGIQTQTLFLGPALQHLWLCGWKAKDPSARRLATRQDPQQQLVTRQGELP